MNTQDTPSDDRTGADNPAADLIRQKLQQLYTDEPDAREELQESQAATSRSKHQDYMFKLSQSGRSLAEIQTAWHNYYVELPSDEKHQVWQEFYQEHSQRGAVSTSKPVVSEASPQVHPMQQSVAPQTIPQNDARSVSDIKQQLLRQVHKRSTHKKKGHLNSIMFGLSSGFVVLAIMLFGFFNERFLAPFITPSKAVSATPIIIDPGNSSVGPEPKIIIPKINVEIPVVYTEPSTEESAIQKALEQGVVHYATTSNPGESGNGAIFGHSSNNILNSGKYKFAFVLLKRLEAGDTFILQKGGKRYVYRVFTKKIVKPDDLAVLGDSQGKPATMSLITCDPPGTSINRLVVTGEQITPDPGVNTKPNPKKTESKPSILPSNSPSLWSRLTSWLRN